jgi:hypothetical protein
MTVLEEFGRDNALKSDIQCKFYESSGDVPDPKDLDKTKKKLMILDDLQLEKQKTCETYYIRVDTAILTAFIWHRIIADYQDRR